MDNVQNFDSYIFHVVIRTTDSLHIKYQANNNVSTVHLPLKPLSYTEYVFFCPSM
jgi:hypothetical protein